MDRCSTCSHRDVYRGCPHVRLALRLTNHSEGVCYGVVAACEGLAVHLVVLVVCICHALFERGACDNGVCDHVVADVPIGLGNRWLVGWWHQHLVDDVDHAVGCHYVS